MLRKVAVLLPAVLALSVVAAAPAAADPPDPVFELIDTTGIGFHSAFKAMHSGRCLDNQGSDANQGHIVQKACDGSSRQDWQFLPLNGGNTYELRNGNSSKCLDVPASTANGTVLVQHECHGGINQQWRLEPANAGLFFGALKIHSLYSDKCVDVLGISINDSAEVGQWDCILGQTNQDWIPV